MLILSFLVSVVVFLIKQIWPFIILGLAIGFWATGQGVISFDSSLGELGGCPYAPGATGNVCSEELAYMFELDGYDTTLDISYMLELVADLEGIIGRTVPSLLAKAGIIKF